MAKRPKALLLSSIAWCALLMFFAACASRQHGEASQEATAQVAANVSAAQAGSGFVCTGDTTAFGCACKWGEPASSIYSCTGMEALCKVFGSKVECGAIWCTCGGVYR